MAQFLKSFSNWFKDKLELSRGKNSNVRPMEGIRGFAVFMVFLVHYTTLITPWLINKKLLFVVRDIHNLGNVGVDLFFVLSGFLIYGSLISKKQSFFPYFWRRIVRIYPTFIVVFVIYLLLSYLVPSESKLPADKCGTLILLLQNFFLLPGLFPILTINTVTWSLSYEMFYYLIIPVLISVFKLHKQSSSTRILIFTLSTLIFSIIGCIYGGHTRLLMFVAGILAHELKNSTTKLPNNFFVMFIFFFALAIRLAPLYGNFWNTIQVCILFFSFGLLLLTILRNPHSWLPSIFSWTPLRWLGNSSYSYYLIHGLTLKFLFFIIQKYFPTSEFHFSTGIVILLLPFSFIISLIPATVLFLAVERPFSLRLTR